MYALVGMDGKVYERSEVKTYLVEIARTRWPEQHQDDSGDFEDPNGWDIRVTHSAP